MSTGGEHAGRIEHWVHWTLLAGLVLSLALLVAGLGLVLLRHQPRPVGLPPPVKVAVRAAARGYGVALIDLGLLVLIATPVVRVAVLALGWGLEGNRRFLTVALAVLALLGLSMVLGTG